MALAPLCSSSLKKLYRINFFLLSMYSSVP